MTFTASKDRSFTLPDAVNFVSGDRRTQVLQSAQEAEAFRYILWKDNGETGDESLLNYSTHDQHTRTAGIVFKTQGTWYEAFDDDPRPDHNIILAKAREGYAQNSAGRAFSLPLQSQLVKEAIERAAKADRIVKITYRSLELLIGSPRGPLTEGEHSLVGNSISRAILGYAAPLNAEFVRGHIFKSSEKLYLPKPSDFEKTGNATSNAQIRAVIIGGVDSDGWTVDYAIRADGNFNNSAFARGVVGSRNFS